MSGDPQEDNIMSQKFQDNDVLLSDRCGATSKPVSTTAEVPLPQ
jgi:hypothetical protein